MFADLHCHAHMRSYMCLRQKRGKYEKKGMYHPWTVVATNMSRLKNVDRAAGYSQSDLVTLWNGGSRLVWNSLYPIEKGFFKTPTQPTGGKHQMLRRIARVATHHKAPLRTLMQHLTMRIPTATIRFITSEEYDYWEFLQDEYAFISSKSGIKTKNEIYTLGVARKTFENSERRRTKYPDYYHAEGTYQIPRNRAEAVEIAQKKEEVMMMALSIEGAHVFGAETESDQTVLDRVDFIKKEWEHPLFFITYTHHFNNGLCGHAHSLPEVAAYVLNQDSLMSEGFTDLGWKVIRKLLSVDANNNPAPEEGYRVLIDLKHMSPLGRKEYYEYLIRPCMEKGDTIPLIASHCSYAARRTLQEIIDVQEDEDDTFRVKTEEGPFYAWGINFCDEDIYMIHATGGLFGLSFDKRMLGVSSKKREEREEQINNINAMWNNIKAVLRVIYTDTSLLAAEKQKSWDMLAIGTDFDGYIDPISTYKTAIELNQFKADLLAKIKEEAAKENPLECVAHFNETFTPELVVDKICYDNALAFTLKHYPEQ
jgi:microsomal dipeptidase-like Zn-dependent dipeptidase